jgi:hypothetical protein
MTVEFLSTKVIRDGDDNATSFAFPFVITEASDLVANLVDDEGVEDADPLELGVDYSVTPSGAYPTTGSITYPLVGDPLPAGWKIVIRRVLPLTQTTRLRNQGGYFAEVQERTFDRLTMQVQQLQEQIDRAFLLPLLGFEGLSGAVPRVNLAETAIEYALGLTGAPGAPGVAGSAGPAGPWSFLGTEAISAAADHEITTLGDSSIVAICLMFENLTVDTDATNILARWRKNGTIKTSGYDRTNRAVRAGSSTPNTDVSAAASNGIITGSSANFNLGNAAGEALNGLCYIFSPHASAKHRATIYTVFDNTSGEVVAHEGSMSYDGVDFDSPITGIQLLASAGTFSGNVHVFGISAENAKVPVVASQFTLGVLGASEIVLRYVFTEDAAIGIDFVGSQASAGVAATAEAVFGITVNGLSGPTMTFAAAADVATFDNAGQPISLLAGDVLEITAPATPDATLADLSISIRALAESV